MASRSNQMLAFAFVLLTLALIALLDGWGFLEITPLVIPAASFWLLGAFRAGEEGALRKDD